MGRPTRRSLLLHLFMGQALTYFLLTCVPEWQNPIFLIVMPESVSLSSGSMHERVKCLSPIRGVGDNLFS